MDSPFHPSGFETMIGEQIVLNIAAQTRFENNKNTKKNILVLH
jgi:hypothetical protein